MIPTETPINDVKGAKVSIWFYVVLALSILALIGNFVAYPVDGQNQIIGFPVPFVVFEPSAAGDSYLDFSSVYSPLFFLFNMGAISTINLDRMAFVLEQIEVIGFVSSH